MSELDTNGQGNSEQPNGSGPNGMATSGSENGYDKFRKYWWLVKRKLWLVILLAVIGGVYKYNEIIKVQEVYRSVCKVILDGSATDRAVALLDIPGARYGFDNEMLILKSDKLAQKVADRLYESFRNSDKKDTLGILKASNGGLRNRDEVTRKVKNKVSFRAGNEKQSILYIYANAYAPEDAMKIANTYAYTYKQDNIQSSVKQVNEAKQYLDEKIEETEKRLGETERQILEFYKEHGYSSSSMSTDALIEQVSSLHKKLDEARVQQISNREEINAIDSTLKASRNQDTDVLLDATDNLISYYEEQIKELTLQKEQEKAKLTNVESGNTNSTIKVINDKLAHNRSKLKDLLDKKLDSPSLLSSVDGSIAKYWVELKARKTKLQNENSALPGKIKNLRSQIAEYEQELERIPQLEMQLDKLKRKRDLYANSVSNFYSRLIEMELAEASEGGYVEILDPAQPNYRPINKQTTAGVFQGAFFGVVAAIFLIIALDRLDDRVKSDEDIKELNLRVVSSIPSMDSVIDKEFQNKNFIDYKGAFVSTKLITLLNPMSGISEMYRRLRTHFMFSLPDKDKKSVLTTSANPQEGKSLTAANLAIVLAQSGKQVALIDADLRRPNLDILFGVPKSPGISDHIINHHDYEDLIKPTVVENLFVVPAGSQVPNPSEILGSETFRELYNKISGEFDYLIVDSPPLNSVVDAISLTELVDQWMMVINVGKTHKKGIRQSLDLLNIMRHKMAGVLLNNIDQKSYITDYNYYQNYNYYGNRTAMTDIGNGNPREKIDA